MEAQLRLVSKKEAHSIIESLPGDYIMMLTFNEGIGISTRGKRIKKKKGQKLVCRAKSLVLTNNEFVNTLNLYDALFSDISWYKNKKENNIVRKILIP